MLIKTINTGDQLRQEFEAWGRWGEFSSFGFDALADYFAECGEAVELDIPAICLEFRELRPDELVRDYAPEYGETAEEIAEAIADETWIIELKNGYYLLQAF